MKRTRYYLSNFNPYHTACIVKVVPTDAFNDEDDESIREDFEATRMPLRELSKLFDANVYSESEYEFYYANSHYSCYLF